MPGRYDGYLTETERGYEVGAAGVVVGTYADEGEALAILAEHAGDRPKWRVDRDGRTQPIV